MSISLASGFKPAYHLFMDINAFINAERKSPCCAGRIQVVYKTITSSRTAAVYICLTCDRLHVIDSRDEEAK